MSKTTGDIQIKYVDCENEVPINVVMVPLNISFVVGEVLYWDKDISDRFTSMEECPILRYKVNQTVDARTN